MEKLYLFGIPVSELASAATVIGTAGLLGAGLGLLLQWRGFEEGRRLQAAEQAHAAKLKAEGEAHAAKLSAEGEAHEFIRRTIELRTSLLAQFYQVPETAFASRLMFLAYLVRSNTNLVSQLSSYRKAMGELEGSRLAYGVELVQRFFAEDKLLDEREEAFRLEFLTRQGKAMERSDDEIVVEMQNDPISKVRRHFSVTGGEVFHLQKEWETLGKHAGSFVKLRTAEAEAQPEPAPR